MAYWYIDRYLLKNRGTSRPQALHLLGGQAAESSTKRHLVSQNILIMIEHLFESAQVEAISNVLLVHLAEKLMVLKVAEPADPPITFFGAVRITL